MRKIIYLTKVCLVIASIVFGSACGTSIGLSQDKNSGKKVTLIAKMLSGGYWNMVRQGAEAAAKEFGVELAYEAPNDENDVAGQVELMRKAVRSGTGALILAANDYKALSAEVELADREGIPVLTIDSNVDSKKVTSYIGTDNYKAGEQMGKKLIELTGGHARVAVVSFIQGTDNADQREKGLFDTIARYPEIQIAAKEYCRSNRQLASELTHRILTEGGQLDAIVALNTIASEGVAAEIERMGLGGKVKVIAFDNTEEEMDWLQDGIIQATVIQNPFSMGYLGVKYAAEALKGRKIPERVVTGTKVIDNENMFWMENQKLLFPFIN